MNVFPKLATVLFSVVFFWDGVAIGADGVTVANPPLTIAQAKDGSAEANRKPAAAGKKPDSPYGSARKEKDARKAKGAPKAMDPCRTDPEYPGCQKAKAKPAE